MAGENKKKGLGILVAIKISALDKITAPFLFFPPWHLYPFFLSLKKKIKNFSKKRPKNLSPLSKKKNFFLVKIK